MRPWTLVFFLVILVNTLAHADDISYDAGGRRDPFVPLQGSAGLDQGGPGAAITLEGIIYDPGAQSIAIIGGQPYKTGEAVGEAVIVEIRKDHVVIDKDGERKQYWIREDEQLQNNDGGAAAS